MAAFDELDFTRFDFWAVVADGGIAVVDPEHRESCLASLRRQGYGIESIDFRQGIASAVPEINELFRWEEQFLEDPFFGVAGGPAWDLSMHVQVPG